MPVLEMASLLVLIVNSSISRCLYVCVTSPLPSSVYGRPLGWPASAPVCIPWRLQICIIIAYKCTAQRRTLHIFNIHLSGIRAKITSARPATVRALLAASTSPPPCYRCIYTCMCVHTHTYHYYQCLTYDMNMCMFISFIKLTVLVRTLCRSLFYSMDWSDTEEGLSMTIIQSCCKSNSKFHLLRIKQ